MGLRRLKQSFANAGMGLWQVVREEQSFRIQLVFTAIVVVLMLVFPLSALERLILVMVIISVLVLEIINSIFERIVDVYKPRLNPYVRDIKDMMAAAVLIVSIGATIIGLMIFVPHIADFWIR